MNNWNFKWILLRLRIRSSLRRLIRWNLSWQALEPRARWLSRVLLDWKMNHLILAGSFSDNWMRLQQELLDWNRRTANWEEQSISRDLKFQILEVPSWKLRRKSNSLVFQLNNSRMTSTTFSRNWNLNRENLKNFGSSWKTKQSKHL